MGRCGQKNDFPKVGQWNDFYCMCNRRGDSSSSADINNLKKINDTYGHYYGDILIQNGAEALKTVWSNQSIYRVGGDEFVVLYPNAVKETVEKEIEALDKVIDERNKQNNRKALHLQMAIGMAEYDPETDKRYMDVFRRADSAMYENKKAKKEANM